jgi:hypothetical protein
VTFETSMSPISLTFRDHPTGSSKYVSPFSQAWQHPTTLMIMARLATAVFATFCLLATVAYAPTDVAVVDTVAADSSTTASSGSTVTSSNKKRFSSTWMATRSIPMPQRSNVRLSSIPVA